MLAWLESICVSATSSLQLQVYNDMAGEGHPKNADPFRQLLGGLPSENVLAGCCQVTYHKLYVDAFMGYCLRQSVYAFINCFSSA